MNSSPDIHPADDAGLASKLTRYNPPGLGALTYRGGKYVPTLGRLLSRLPTQTIAGATGEATDVAPLANLNIQEHHDWAVALLHAVAAVTEVLSFYQERIVNEGYLRTATEHRSVLELARTVGYELQPGVAASTFLALTVLTGKDEPPRQVVVPPGVAVQSIPAPGQLPQIFETSAEFVARSDWNALRLAYAPDRLWPQFLRQDAPSVRLVGSNTGLKPGTAILILGDPLQPGRVERPWLVATLKTIQADPQRDYTVVTWENEWGAGWSNGRLRNPQLFVLRQQAALWGYTQGGVYSSPNRQTNWAPVAIGLPHMPVHALIDTARGTLFAGAPKGLFRSLDRGESWQPVSVSLGQKDILALATNEEGSLFAGTNDGGIYLSQDNGENWSAASGETVVIPPWGLAKLLPHPYPPLPKTVVRALDICRRGNTPCLAAGTDKGVFLSADHGKTWQPMNRDLPKTDPKTGLTSIVAWALAGTGAVTAPQQGKDQLFAGTDAGVFHIKPDPNWALVTAAVVALALIASSLIGTLSLVTRLDSISSSLIGALIGLARNILGPLSVLIPALSNLTKALPPKFTWSPLARLVHGLAKALQAMRAPIEIIQRHSVFVTNTLLIGAAIGALIWGVRFLVRILCRRPAVSLGIPVHALAVGQNGQLFAGTEKGVFRSNDNHDGNLPQRIWNSLSSFLLGDLLRRWQLVNAGLTSQDIRALAVGPEGELLAGTQDGALFRSDNHGDAWEAWSIGLSLKSVQSVSATTEGYFAAGAPADSPVEKEWSPFQIEKRKIDLDKPYADLAPGSWVVLHQSQAPSVALVQARAVAVADSQDSRPGQFTRVEVDQAKRLATFDRTTTVVLTHSEPLAVYADAPVEKDRLTLDHSVTGLEPGHRLIVGGKRLRARLVAADGLKLVSDDGLRSVKSLPGDPLQVIRVTAGAAPNTKQWQLKDKNGFIGSVTTAANAISLEPAAADDETVSEMVVVRSVKDDRQQTTITLQTPLGNFYDRSTVTIYGNVLHATHGQTVADEVLGASESMATNQSFPLKQRPLTFTTSATAGGADSSLSVQINDVDWHEVTALHKRDRGLRAYMVRQDAKGDTLVIFGDGDEGAGIPSGTQQITATYRIGLGRAGNVPAGSLSLLQTAVPGIKGVTNPAAATGGSDPETMDAARATAPLTLRALQRIVSLTDFEDFARMFPGLGKAQVRQVSMGRKSLLHLTIAGAAGEAIPKESDRCQALAQAIEAYRALPLPPLWIDSYELVYFNVQARVLIDPDQRGRMDAIKADIKSALTNAFAFARREFGQAAAASEVIAVVQNIRGVVGVELIHLYIRGNDEKLNPSLDARLARPEGETIHPAQLVLINPVPNDGIKLKLEIAP